VPEGAKRRAEEAERWPWRVASQAPVSASHSLMLPSACPLAIEEETAAEGEEAMQETASEGDEDEGAKETEGRPRLRSQAARRSRAAARSRRPEGS